MAAAGTLTYPTHRGKGDYYRLGHGDDSHQRTPKRVMGPLAHERVVDMACGSLHCVVCTTSGHIFTWGDNDEGQIGNDTTQPVKSPMVCRWEGGAGGGAGESGCIWTVWNMCSHHSLGKCRSVGGVLAMPGAEHVLRIMNRQTQ